jgi:phosphatidylserine/phosphatidylglycerophosphate/cardiolipin synthase-like enzyme
MPTFASGKIEAYAGPKDLKGPDDLEQVIVDFIDGAEESLDIAVQELDNERIAKAILAAQWRGISIRIVLEQSYLREEDLKVAKPPKPKQGETAEQALERWQWDPEEGDNAVNRRLATALLQSDVDLKIDFNKEIFHQKFVVRDYRGHGKGKPTSALLSGSTNFTDTDCHSNLNHIFVFHDAGICEQYANQFAEIERGEFGPRGLGGAPPVFDLAGVPVTVLFAPDNFPEQEVVKQVLKAEKEIEFAIFTFAGSSAIDDALLMAARADCDVTGVLDRGQAGQSWTAPYGEPGGAPPWLDRENISLHVPEEEEKSGVRKLHHKLMVVDHRTVLAGSFNYTNPANAFNDENLFVLGCAYDIFPDRRKDKQKELEKIDVAACREIAKYMADEIDRIISSVSEDWPPKKKKKKDGGKGDGG